MSEKLKGAIKGLNIEGAKKAAEEAIASGAPPLTLLNSMVDSIKELGQLFKEGNGIYFPQMIIASRAFEAAYNILNPSADDVKASMLGTIVLGTVEGDWNDFGLYTVAFSFMGAGFRVHNIGINCRAKDFIDEAIKVNADIIGISCLLWSQMYKVKEVIEEIEEKGLRKRFKVLIGGGHLWTHPYWPKRVGADGSGRDSFEAIEEAKRVLGRK